MAEHTLAWKTGHEVMGPLLEAAVEEMNTHGPFTVDDEATEKAPKYAELVDGVFRVMSPASGFHGITATALARLLDVLLGDKCVVGTHMPVRTAHNTLREPDVAVFGGGDVGIREGGVLAARHQQAELGGLLIGEDQAGGGHVQMISARQHDVLL